MTSGQTAAERMRRSRQRRRQGLACLTIEIKLTEIDELVRRGLVQEPEKNDYQAVLRGIYEHLDRTLGEL